MLDLIRFICGEVAWVQAVPERGDVQSIPHSEFCATDPRVTSLIGWNRAGHIPPRVTRAMSVSGGYAKTGRVRATGMAEQVYKCRRPGVATSYRLGAPDFRPFPTTPLFQRIAEALCVETDDHPLDETWAGDIPGSRRDRRFRKTRKG